MFRVAFIGCIFLSLGYSDAKIAGGMVEQSVVQPGKTEYARADPYSDKHSYGVEVAENKQFHHTTTAEDGVRLGCYGHVHEGKPQSTQYVADERGYRVVTNHGLISVYPTTGGERKASFVGQFNEDARMSQNIRFFFPRGCGRADLDGSGSTDVFVTVKPPTLKSRVTVKPTVTVRPTGTLKSRVTETTTCSCTCDNGRSYTQILQA